MVKSTGIFSHCSRAFRTNDRGYKMDNGSPLFALLIIVKEYQYILLSSVYFRLEA